MGLERLWSPWRMAYIEPATAKVDGDAKVARGSAPRRPAACTGTSTRASSARRGKSARAANSREEPGEGECLFCRVAASHADRANLVLARRPYALLMLNRYPYNPAHVMVAVRAHKGRFTELTPAEARDLVELIGVAERALTAEYRPHGTNYGANEGRVAGAGFPGHLHMHLVPRWNGDTNFMPVVGETRVLPESLERTWQRLSGAIRGLTVPVAIRGAKRGARR